MGELTQADFYEPSLQFAAPLLAQLQPGDDDRRYSTGLAPVPTQRAWATQSPEHPSHLPEFLIRHKRRRQESFLPWISFLSRSRGAGLILLAATAGVGDNLDCECPTATVQVPLSSSPTTTSKAACVPGLVALPRQALVRWRALRFPSW